MAANNAHNNKRTHWRKNLVWTVVTFVIMGVLFMAIERKKNATITQVGISIKGIKGGKDLVTKKGVKTMFRNYLGYELEMSAIRDLDLMDMERMLERDDRIQDAEVYVDSKDRLYIAILQREPIVRVFSKNNTSYYLDSKGMVIPAFKGSTIRVPVASGNIDDYKEGFLEGKHNTLQDVYAVAKYIHEDEFLSALIEQIDIQDNGEIMMVPKVGRQKLDFGHVESTEMLAERFDKMKQMYKGGMEHLGWRKYDVLTLKYDTHKGSDEGKDYHLIYGQKRQQ